MSGLIGRKIGMTSLFTEDGKNVPCTVIEAGPCVVTQVRTLEVDGYEALQLGFDDKKDNQTGKAEAGHFKKAGTDAKRKVVEFRGGWEKEYNLGDQVTIEHFILGEFVDVSGISKGKGFQGVVKRHGFAGAERTHGQQSVNRAPGSIGAASYPARVFKNKKMPGRTGGERVTVKNLEVLKLDLERNLIILKGCVPGHRNAYVTIEK